MSGWVSPEEEFSRGDPQRALLYRWCTPQDVTVDPSQWCGATRAWLRVTPRSDSGEPPSCTLGELALGLACDADLAVRQFVADVFLDAFDMPEEFGRRGPDPMFEFCTPDELADVQVALAERGGLDAKGAVVLARTVLFTAEILAARGELDELMVGTFQHPEYGVPNTVALWLEIFARHLGREAIDRIVEIMEQHASEMVRQRLGEKRGELREVTDRRFGLGDRESDLRDTAERVVPGRGKDLRAAAGRGARWSGLDLRGCDLTGVDLTGADLSGANLTGALLYRATLAGADLDRAVLEDAMCSGADFRGASLFAVDGVTASFVDADFRGANLTAARLRGANVQGADFRGARTHALDLSGCTQAGAQFDDR